MIIMALPAVRAGCFRLMPIMGSQRQSVRCFFRVMKDFIAPLAGLPSRWENGSYDGLSARGNFEVSARWTDGQADSFTILSKSGGECKVKYDNVAGAVVTDEDGSSVSFTADGDDMIIFDTAKGQSYTISGLPFRAAVQDASNLTLNVNPDKQLEVSWKASPDAVSYNIYRAEESSAVYERYAEGVAGVSYTGETLKKECRLHIN